MGLDCCLLPIDHDTPDFGFSHSILRLERTGIAQALLEAKGATSPPARFETFYSHDRLCDKPECCCCQEPHYGDTTEDCYGEPLPVFTAGELVSRFGHKRVIRESQRNRAVWAYLATVDPNMRIAVFFS